MDIPEGESGDSGDDQSQATPPVRMLMQTGENGQLGGPEGENWATHCLQQKQALQGQREVEPGQFVQESDAELQSLGQNGVG